MKRLLLALALLSAALRAEDPRLVIESGGHLSIIYSVAFTRDGKYLVSAGDDKVGRVWDVNTGQVVRVLRGQIGEGQVGQLYAAALSPDNRYLAVAGWLGADAGTWEQFQLRAVAEEAGFVDREGFQQRRKLKLALAAGEQAIVVVDGEGRPRPR